MADPTQYILLPRTGLKADSGPALNTLAGLPTPVSTQQPERVRFDIAGGREMLVLDSLAENGAKLVELDRDSATAINVPDSPLRAVPVVEYSRPDPRPQPLAGPPIGVAAGPTSMTITVTDNNSGAAVVGVDVRAFTNFASRRGDQGRTDSGGNVTLRLYGASIERLYCYPTTGYWGAFRSNLPIQPSIQIRLTPVSLNFTDCVRHYYGSSQFNRTTGVSVGVIDTGVGPHNDLNVVGGRNTVTGELATDYQDGDIHGTHVAGLIGANGSTPNGLQGLAPDVPIQAYRVFGFNATGATNYAILKAMIFAADDGCDIINLSLGGGPYDDIVKEAITDARNQGMLVVIAAGNDCRKAVNYPAAYSGATAVSAMGREGTFPIGSLEEGDVLYPPYSTMDSQEFVAEFSNIGPQIAVIGPGVGALSTLPHNQYGPLSGTSMAAPVVAGAAVSLLSQDSATYNMPRDRARSDAIERLLQSRCVRRGFGLVYEGYGLPDPGAV